jgi:integrase
MLTSAHQSTLPREQLKGAKLFTRRKKYIRGSPITGRPYDPGNIQQKVIRKTGDSLGIDNLGWHTFRHTYRSLLGAVGAPVGVQQKLMRHAQVSTTMNTYGDTYMFAKREANSKAVKMVLFGVDSTPGMVANAS